MSRLKMGAAVGYDELPKHLCDGLVKREVLDAMFERVCKVNQEMSF